MKFDYPETSIFSKIPKLRVFHNFEMLLVFLQPGFLQFGRDKVWTSYLLREFHDSVVYCCGVTAERILAQHVNEQNF